jgi:ubiquinone/menaquinone biosynthesis C-methylase UbiE
VSERLYGDLAAWWPVLSPSDDYAEEAEFFRRTIVSASAFPPETMLELGSGGGNNASHPKSHFRVTLVDRSPGMLAVSRALNPECERSEIEPGTCEVFVGIRGTR